jgi:hypothetical protein
MLVLRARYATDVVMGALAAFLAAEVAAQRRQAFGLDAVGPMS